MQQARRPLDLHLLGFQQAATMLAVPEVVLEFLLGLVEVPQQSAGLFAGVLQLALILLAAFHQPLKVFLQFVLALHQ
jgi:hypothetical protein